MSTILTNKIETKSGGLTLDPGSGGSVTVLGSLSGTISTAAQPNITSVGTLSSLAVSGDVFIADKIVHTGDTNTAIRFPSADTVTIETAGAERMRIDSSGNVGIGTSSPSARLEIGNTTASSGGVGPTAFRIQRSDGTNPVLAMGPSEDVQSPSSPGALISSENRSLQIGTRAGISDVNFNGIYFDNGSHTSFHTNGSEKMRILSSGGITFNGDTATANALDDYEEGTWTPVFRGATTAGSYTHSIMTGKYTKIGNMVTVWCTMVDATEVSPASGLMLITGLPFNVRNDLAFDRGSFPMRMRQNAVARNNAIGQTVRGSDQVRFSYDNADGGGTSMDFASDYAAGIDIGFIYTYFV